ncbi:PH domain-containing protein [Rutstroemia sp. NJR-2017a BVV2]|nr:PH domain-containing protein [Rutstroemia sp. NJR-2017a BVV2]
MTGVFSNHVAMDEITFAPLIPINSSSSVASMEDRKTQNDMSDQDVDVDGELEGEGEGEDGPDQEEEVEDKPAGKEYTDDPLLDSPPSYDASIRSHKLQSRFNIQPREDEGREALPGYSTAISLQSVFLRKMELQGAVHRAGDRNWYRVIATLQGTALSFHKIKTSSVFGRSDGRKGTPDYPSGTKRGSLISSYNLQHADVGIAADYVKKRYVIRVRAEADQFLLSCIEIETFVHWLQSLFTAIDLALPLDERQIPRDQSIPRSRRRRRANVEISAGLVREQEEIIRRHYPQLATSASSEEPNSRQTRPSTASTSRARNNTCSTQAAIQEALRDLGLVDPPRRRRALRRRTSNTGRLNSSISSETGKWQPEHQWCSSYDMLYARKCMALLTSRSPRKSNYMILKGKQWKVDWETGTLTTCEPPDYGDDYWGTWKIGPYGTLTKA